MEEAAPTRSSQARDWDSWLHRMCFFKSIVKGPSNPHREKQVLEPMPRNMLKYLARPVDTGRDGREDDPAVLPARPKANESAMQDLAFLCKWPITLFLSRRHFLAQKIWYRRASGPEDHAHPFMKGLYESMASP